MSETVVLIIAGTIVVLGVGFTILTAFGELTSKDIFKPERRLPGRPDPNWPPRRKDPPRQ